MGKRLSRRVENLLHDGSRGDDPAPADREEGPREQCDRVDNVVHERNSYRGRASARERRVSLEISEGPPAQPADRTGLEVLSKVLGRVGREAGEARLPLRETPADVQAVEGRS